MSIQDIAQDIPLSEYFRLIFKSEQDAQFSANEAYEYLNELEQEKQQN